VEFQEPAAQFEHPLIAFGLILRQFPTKTNAGWPRELSPPHGIEICPEFYCEVVGSKSPQVTVGDLDVIILAVKGESLPDNARPKRWLRS